MQSSNAILGRSTCQNGSDSLLHFLVCDPLNFKLTFGFQTVSVRWAQRTFQSEFLYWRNKHPLFSEISLLRLARNDARFQVYLIENMKRSALEVADNFSPYAVSCFAPVVAFDIY
jgi:hypothetical protein